MRILQGADGIHQHGGAAGCRLLFVLLQRLGQAYDELLRVFGRRRHQQVAVVADQLAAQAVVLHSLSRQPFHGLHGAGKIAGSRGRGNLKKIILADQPGRFADRLHRDLAAMRPAEIQQRKRIAHSAIGNAGNKGGGLFGKVYPLLPCDIQQPVPNDLRGDPLEIKPLAAGLNGRGDLVHFGGR